MKIVPKEYATEGYIDNICEELEDINEESRI